MTHIQMVAAALMIGGIGCSFASILNLQMKKFPEGNDHMNKIALEIRTGAKSFLLTEYKYLFVFCFVLTVTLTVLFNLHESKIDNTDGWRKGGCFVVGALFSAATGFSGMLTATSANVRTTQAAQDHGLAAALKCAFTGGAVMGFSVVSTGLVGVAAMFVFCAQGREDMTVNDSVSSFMS